MTRSRMGYFLAALAILIAAVLAMAPVSCRNVPDVSSATQLQRKPHIAPDYTSLVIPPNIAPLNFRILEKGNDFIVRISADDGEMLLVACPDGNCRIPLRAWRKLLQEGRSINFDVFAQAPDGTWEQFKRFSNDIASEPIDSYVVYRLLVPNKARSEIHGIFQRDLESFRESALVTTRDGSIQCFNCHTFHQHDPNKFLIHVRREHEGMVIVTDGEIRKINTRQDPMFRPLAYASWHPNGRHIAATCNRFIGHTPSNDRTYYFHALEKRGDLVVYDVETNTLGTTKSVFENEYIETHPCWSADGQYIYYCRSKDFPVVKPEDWNASKADMMRVSYDVTTDTWGTPEIVRSFSEEGVSCSFPRPSPCGKYVLHILADKTTYPIHQESSDVYLLDLETNETTKLTDVCSEWSESYPRWSSNGRWFTFLSNRGDGMSALPYIAYFDADGKAHKAFVLPQKNPEFFDTFTDTFNALELVKSRVNISTFKLAQGIMQEATDAKFPNPPRVDVYTGPTKLTGNQVLPE